MEQNERNTQIHMGSMSSKAKQCLIKTKMRVEGFNFSKKIFFFSQKKKQHGMLKVFAYIVTHIYVTKIGNYDYF